MSELFEQIFKGFLIEKGFLSEKNDKGYIAYKNSDFVIEFIHDYRFDEVGINFKNQTFSKSKTFQDCYGILKGDEFKNEEFLLKDLYSKSQQELERLEFKNITFNTILIYSALIVVRDNYSQIVKIINELN